MNALTYDRDDLYIAKYLDMPGMPIARKQKDRSLQMYGKVRQVITRPPCAKQPSTRRSRQLVSRLQTNHRTMDECLVRERTIVF